MKKSESQELGKKKISKRLVRRRGFIVRIIPSVHHPKPCAVRKCVSQTDPASEIRILFCNLSRKGVHDSHDGLKS